MKTKISICIYLIAGQTVLAQNVTNRLHEIDGLIGTWNVVVETRLSPSGPWDTSNARSVIKKTTENVAIEEDFIGILKGKSFKTKTLIAFDHFSNKFQQVFIDSEHGVLVDYEGVKKADTIFFDNTWVYPNKTTVKLRVVYKLFSRNEFTIENMRMPENTSIWDITGRRRYVRSS